MSYERANIQATAGYLPGEQPADPRVVKLNTNENPYPPGEAVMAALASIKPDQLRRYPPPTATEFRRTAARVHQVSPENIIATNGGDELLRLAITTFVEVGAPIGYAEPSYSLYPVLAAIHGSPVHRVALNEDWSIPDDLPEKMNQAHVQLTFVVNPHAPSGRLASSEQLADLARRLDGVLVIDEAYVDFVDPQRGHDCVELIRRFDNVLILRSLSKGYSLAGLRFGYGIGPVNLIQPILEKTRDSYNTDAISQTLATAALVGRAEAAQTWQAVRDQRRRVSDELNAMGLRCDPSQSNFILATVSDDLAGGAAAIYAALKSAGVLVRYFDADRLRDKLRITVGTVEENSALLQALGRIIGR